MSYTEIEAVVLTTLANIIKNKVDSSGADVVIQQLDSLKHVEFIFAVEDEMGVQFSQEELVDMDSVDKIVTRVMARHEA